MEMASIINQYYDAFIDKHGNTALPSHLKALQAMQNCRTPDSGELYVSCPECDHAEWRPCHVDIEAARNARTMMPVCGSIGNRPNCYLSPILWLPSHYHIS